MKNSISDVSAKISQQNKTQKWVEVYSCKWMWSSSDHLMRNVWAHNEISDYRLLQSECSWDMAVISSETPLLGETSEKQETQIMFSICSLFHYCCLEETIYVLKRLKKFNFHRSACKEFIKWWINFLFTLNASFMSWFRLAVKPWSSLWMTGSPL